jgi:hypothetical protein
MLKDISISVDTGFILMVGYYVYFYSHFLNRGHLLKFYDFEMV